MKTNITIEMNPINCGIYEFRHIETGQAYVGSAIDVRTRIAQHFKDLSKGRHHSKKAQALYDASPSGNSAFTATLIHAGSIEELDDLEDGYIQSGDYRLNTATGKFGRKARRANPPKPKTPKLISTPKKRGPKKTVERTPEEQREYDRLRKRRQREAAKTRIPAAQTAIS